MTMATSVAIIGTAGRGVAGKRMTSALFEGMLSKTQQIIHEQLQISSSKLHLVSGGAAWSDHIAVLMFLTDSEASLTLHLPCGWDSVHGRYVDSGKTDWRTNPGRLANKCHQQFSTKTGRDTFQDIQNAISVGACATVHKGFHNRNSEIAKSEILIAFSWSTSGFPLDGGTADTWKKSNTNKKIHVGLLDLIQELGLDEHHPQKG